MDYVSIEDARNAGGLRLALTADLPAPWSEAAKGVFHVRQVDYLPVRQEGGGANEELVAWTGHRNAPTAMYADEPARTSALDMINLAERLGSGASLVPQDMDERILMFGLLNELAGENGLVWSARNVMFKAMVDSAGEAAMAGNPMLKEYHYDPADVAAAPGRVIGILQRLSAQLEQQRTAGSRYLIGDALTALDIYWTCFSQVFDALPADVNPMPEFMRQVWGMTAGAIKQAGYELDPALIEHRDFIYEHHLQLPLDF